MTDLDWNQLMKRSARLDKRQATEFGLFCARLLRPLFVEFCEKCGWPFAERFDQLLHNGCDFLSSKALSEKDVLEIIPDTDAFEDVSVSYASYAGFSLHTALFRQSGPDCVNFVWTVVDLIEYNADSSAGSDAFNMVSKALATLESGGGLGELNAEGFSW